LTDFVFVALLYTHITFVVAWLGATIVGNIVLFPMIPKLRPETQAELGQVMVPRLFRFGMIVGGIALLVGVALYSYINYVATSYATSVSGLPFIQGGALLGLLILVVHTTIQSSTAKKMKALMAQGPPSAETLPRIAGLQRRTKMLARVGFIILLIVLALMVTGSNI
jgi:uncharacterized membrane protein